jgi:AbrB family looped-hinge helix DNA binding protein
METVTVSPKYQVVIPKSVREQLHIVPGQRVHAMAYDGRIELVLVQDVREMRGFARGMDTTVERDGDRV